MSETKDEFGKYFTRITPCDPLTRRKKEDGSIHIKAQWASSVEMMLLIKGLPIYWLNAWKVAMEIGVDILHIDICVDRGSRITEHFSEAITRLSQVRIQSQHAKLLKTSRQCVCPKNCEKCTVVFAIDVTNDDPHRQYAHSKDRYKVVSQLDFVQKGSTLLPVKPVIPATVGGYDDIVKAIPLVLLDYGNTFKADCYVKRNNAYCSKNSNWCPVTRVAIREVMSDIVIDRRIEKKKYSPDMLKIVALSCPMNIFDIEDSGNRLCIMKDRLNKCTRCMQCFDTSRRLIRQVIVDDIEEDIGIRVLPKRSSREEEDVSTAVNKDQTTLDDITASTSLLTLVEDANSKELWIESTGVLSPQTIAIEALEFLYEHLEKIADGLREISNLT